VGEIKRMYVEPAFRGRGIGRRILAALEERGREAGYKRMWLETGTSQPEAVSLYEAAGYRRIAPYGFYRFDPRSLCYEKVL
jgi:ribosomal protein S18 acetylase RimI-like enzyme